MDELFANGQHHTLKAYPVKVFYTLTDQDDGIPVKIMVSVSKQRCFRHAVDRNRAKRQLREAYRKAKPNLVSHILENHPSKTLLLAFIWLSSEPFDSWKIDRAMAHLLRQIQERTL